LVPEAAPDAYGEEKNTFLHRVERPERPARRNSLYRIRCPVPWIRYDDDDDDNDDDDDDDNDREVTATRPDTIF
jgi:hypothetical protein